MLLSYPFRNGSKAASFFNPTYIKSSRLRADTTPARLQLPAHPFSPFPGETFHGAFTSQA
ncbi:hypothetical protein HMPREF3293_00971 [Christensenella minuta]|uniref:Uncharacterized protein n=1 Tax=Christensenella minuta TaxID=626937 RepID=A0A136Q6K4_9FIRM|nr:hypothetical protein HMPREF3293_00971 [Christensenella minuta]